MFGDWVSWLLLAFLLSPAVIYGIVLGVQALNARTAKAALSAKKEEERALARKYGNIEPKYVCQRCGDKNVRAKRMAKTSIAQKTRFHRCHCMKCGSDWDVHEKQE